MDMTRIFKLLGLFYVFSGSLALKCYVCNDYDTGLENCSDPFKVPDVGTAIQVCKPWQFTCYKFVVSHMGHTFHARSCHNSTTSGCSRRENVTLSVSVLDCFCRRELCNTGSRKHKVTHSSMLFVLIWTNYHGIV